MSDKLLTLSGVEEKVGHKKSWIYSAIQTGRFPPGKMIHGKRLWRESEIDKWIDHEWSRAS